MESSSPCHRRRRWLRFSLRSLLILMVIAAMGFGWLGLRIKEARQERAIVAKIMKMGGIVYFHWETPSLFNVPPESTPPQPLWLRRLVGEFMFDDVTAVVFILTPATDEALRECAQLKGVETIAVFGNQDLTDEGLQYLLDLPSVKILMIDDSAITDKGTAIIQKMTTLRQLRIADSPLTDDSIPILKKMTHLTFLQIDGTNISDGGARELHEWMTQNGVGGNFDQPSIIYE